MVCEACSTPRKRWPAERFPLRRAAIAGRLGKPGQWQLHPRSRPKSGGQRRITLEARSELKSLNIDLTAGEAAELMFALGFALEQAARDEARLSPDLIGCETARGKACDHRGVS